MSNILYEIPNDKYSEELVNELFKISRSNPSDEVINNLRTLLGCELKEDAITALVKSSDFILPQIQTENIEILARINDAKFILGHKDKVNCIVRAVDLYFTTYEKTNDLDYLIRALQLVRNAKAIFKQKIPQLQENILELILQIHSSYYQLLIIETAPFLIQEKSLNVLVNHFTNQLAKSFEKHEYLEAQNYIQILNKLEYFSKNEFKLQTALCLEKKADYYTSQKKPYTYTPDILQIYTEALRTIKGIVIDEAIKTRLEQKIKIEQKANVEMLSKIGVSIQSNLNIADLLADRNIKDFKSGFKFLLRYPIIESEYFKTLSQENGKPYLWQQFLGQTLRLTDKGTVSGISNTKDFGLNLARNLYRSNLISLLKEVKHIMDLDRQITKDLIAEMIIRCKSPFIPEGREYFFIEGIYYGFQNNFILASHLLIPQIENSLKQIIELNGRNTIKLPEEIQNDNTLGSILNTEINGKMLDGICNRDLLLELNSFLVDGNSTNFRNRICHGLISTFEANHYGIYLWWLTLKMIKQAEQNFKIS
ncbi:DUF4209 domain-containing protein [Leadbetterella sp. DM7]|uniref:DUF4209 domain-containing protein n=1 Tax=Leadbetterella sp. DM7 TaxID=3235085 RepID=UPI00349E7180